MKKRIMASLVCLCMLIGLLPGMALAADPTMDEADFRSAVTAGGTVTLTGNVTLTSTLNIEKGVTINGENYTITTSTQLNPAFNVKTDKQVSFNNLTLDGAKRGFDLLNTGSKLTLTNCVLNVYQRGITMSSNGPYVGVNLTLDSTKINNKSVAGGNYETGVVHDTNSRGISLWNTTESTVILRHGSELNGFSYCINVSGDKDANGVVDTHDLVVAVEDSTLRGWAGLNVWGSQATYNITRSTVLGINNSSGEYDNFSAIVFNDDLYGLFANLHAVNNILNITDSTVKNYQSGTCLEQLIRIDCGVTQLNLSGEVNFIDTTGNISSVLYLATNSDPITFLNESVHIADGATITCNPADLTFAPTLNALYYWDNGSGGFTGRYVDLKDVFTAANYTLYDGEYIDLLGNAVLDGDTNVTLDEGEGCFTLNFGEYTITGGKLVLAANVSATCDKAMDDVFAAPTGCTLSKSVSGDRVVYSSLPNGDIEAQIGSTYYTTLAAAVAAAQPGDTVTLLANTAVASPIEINKNLTLNLNGHTVTNEVTGDRLFHVTAAVTFKIDGTTADSAMEIPSTNTGSYGFVKISDAATVTLNGGSYTGNTNNGAFIKVSKPNDDSDAPDATVTLNGVTATTNTRVFTMDTGNELVLNVIGGTYTATKEVTNSNEMYSVFGIDCYDLDTPFTFTGATVTTAGGACVESSGGTATYTDCDFTITNTSNPAFTATAVAVSWEGTANIMSGSYSSDGYGVYVYTSGGTINVEDGTISGGTAAACAGVSSSYGVDATINIRGGNLTGALQTYGTCEGATADIVIEGGTFSTDPTAYLAENTIIRKNSDTEFEVLAKTNLTSGVYLTDPTGATAPNYYVSANEDGTYTVYFVAPYVPPTPTTPPTNTETTTNPDGSTTETVTNPDGSKTETTTSKPVTDEAGNTTETKTETTTNTDGSKTETKTETVKGADGSTAETKTETVTNTDGSATETKTETVKAADGSTAETKTETVTAADGTTTSTETVKATDTTGTTATAVTETAADGTATTTVEATVSTQAVTEAAANEAPVTLPVTVSATATAETAPVVSVAVPTTTATAVTVEIPVENMNNTTVAVLVKADGTEEVIKTSKVGEEGVVVTLEGDATVKIVDNSKDFVDVKSDWTEEGIGYVSSRRIFDGTSAVTFSPDTEMTRAMLMTVLARYEGEDTTGGANWYEKGMEWAKQTGVSDGTNPEQSITREQMAVMLYRYAGSPESTNALDYPDADTVSSYALAAMRWAVENGLINGMNGNLNPQGAATRAQVAAIMMRFCQNVAQ